MKLKTGLCNVIGLFTFIILLPLAMSLAGCGKKAPPIPPNRLPLIAPIELKAVHEGEEVCLTWRHTNNKEQGGYEVLRSSVDPNRPPCLDCPMVFRKVGRITVDAATQVVEYKENVADGFIYTYKVQRIGGAGDKWPASNAVVIDLSQ